MKIRRILFSASALLLFTIAAHSQDIRLLETKVADLLARFPANDAENTNKLMGEMLSLGEEGFKLICNKIIPAGTGDDTKARFAVETLSRFLSQKGKETQKEMWEKICIIYATGQKDNGVKDFFMKQLQLIGSASSVGPLKAYLQDKKICGPALAAIQSIGGKTAETALAESLKDKELPCAAAVMNALAEMKSEAAVNEYIAWTSDINADTRASAYNALAQSTSPLAWPVLSRAAKDALYMWEPSGATSALLNYARNAGMKGDLKTMDKICKLVMAKCTDKLSIQNKSAALETYVSFHGMDAMQVLTKALSNPDKSYRNAALMASLAIPGKEAISGWIKYFPKAMPAAKPEIITLLGKSGDESALPLITSSLSNPDGDVRSEAAAALSNISGSKAVPALIEYMTKYTEAGDQEAAMDALMTVSGDKDVALLKVVLKDGPAAAKKSAIEMMAWNRNKEYFKEVLPYTSSQDNNVKSAAFKGLAELAAPGDLPKLLELISATSGPALVINVQDAIASAAGQIADPEKRSDAILKSLADKAGKQKLIPVLARTGGRKRFLLS
jgi:HEAT repeat protein